MVRRWLLALVAAWARPGAGPPGGGTGTLTVADPTTPKQLNIYVGDRYLWLNGVMGPAGYTLAELAVSRVR